MVETLNNTRHPSQPSDVRRFLIAFVSAVVALFVITLALPRLIASVTEGPFEDTMRSISGPNPPPETVIHRVMEVKERSAAAHPTSKTLGDIGFLHLREAIRISAASIAGGQELDASIAAHRSSLTLSPYNAYVWTRLGQDILAKNSEEASSLGAILEMAVAAAPYDSRLVIARVDIGIAAWEKLSDDQKVLINNQIHIAARQSPTALANLARQRLSLMLVVDVLSDDSVLIKRFLYAYAHL